MPSNRIRVPREDETLGRGCGVVRLLRLIWCVGGPCLGGVGPTRPDALIGSKTRKAHSNQKLTAIKGQGKNSALRLLRNIIVLGGHCFASRQPEKLDFIQIERGPCPLSSAFGSTFSSRIIPGPLLLACLVLARNRASASLVSGGYGFGGVLRHQTCLRRVCVCACMYTYIYK